MQCVMALWMHLYSSIYSQLGEKRALRTRALTCIPDSNEIRSTEFSNEKSYIFLEQMLHENLQAAILPSRVTLLNPKNSL